MRREPLPPDPAARAQRMSAEALAGLMNQMSLWVASRIQRSARAGSAPQMVEVELNVKLDGLDDPLHETVSFSLPDASHRAGLGPRGSG